MLDVYPIDIDRVVEIVIKEERAFARTIKQGEEILKKELDKSQKELDAEVAFKLFETYGFPVELTQEIVEEKGLKLNVSKFKSLREKHANVSRGKTSLGMDKQINIIQRINQKLSEFVGYEKTDIETEIIFTGEENEKYYVLLKETPFYATKRRAALW